MKKVFLAMMAAAFFIACNEGNPTTTPATGTDSPKTENIANDAKQTGAAVEKAIEKGVDSPKQTAPKADSPKVK